MNMPNREVLCKLRGHGAPAEIFNWAADHGGDMAELWRDCPRADWMAWMLRYSNVQSRKMLSCVIEDLVALVIGAADTRAAHTECANLLRAYFPNIEL